MASGSQKHQRDQFECAMPEARPPEAKVKITGSRSGAVPQTLKWPALIRQGSAHPEKQLYLILCFLLLREQVKEERHGVGNRLETPAKELKRERKKQGGNGFEIRIRLTRKRVEFVLIRRTHAMP